MRDYEFGNYLTFLRKEAGLSQVELASKLGVTNKAVSKWENGSAKPQLKLLPLLASSLGVSVENLITMGSKKVAKSITKIVITGGPCAGKSTAMSWLSKEMSKKGYGVLFVPESATELILGGVAPWTMSSGKEFQKCVLSHQIQKEKVFERAAQNLYGHDKVLIVCDRGTVDCKAYHETENEYNDNLKQLNTSHTLLRDDYDAVFHLVTAAKGAEEFYTLANNEARTETAEEARKVDDKIISAWSGHPHLRIIDNSTDFEKKLKRLMNEISSFLVEPVSYEIERKFLIKYPDIKKLESNPNCNKVEILQTYLKCNENEEVRVRQRGRAGEYTYTLTTKTLNGLKRVEKEKRITEREYLDFLMNADPTRKQIRKVRYCLVNKTQYFEIDIYPEWKDCALLEIELINENEEILFPKEIEIIKEVTGDENYYNYFLAQIK